MPDPDFGAFEAEALAEGFDEVLERVWAPGTVLAEHTHPFAVKAVLVQGEMHLEVGAETQHLRPGDRFSLPAGLPHAERYGPEGAIYWVARRNPAGGG